MNSAARFSSASSESSAGRYGLVKLGKPLQNHQNHQYGLRLSRDARANTKTGGPGVGPVPHPGFWLEIR